jgi:outer membrane protein assembly factor BamB
MICMLRVGEPLAYRVDAFSTVLPNPAAFTNLLLQDTSAVPALIKVWKQRNLLPVICGARDLAAPLGNGLHRELERIEATHTAMHGSADADDEASSIFLFASSEPPRFLVTAYDRHDGSIEWKRVAIERVPHESHHLESSWATASPVTDGERIYAHFGSAGTYAYTLAGELIWKVDLGDMTTRLGYGEGSSPALWGETLVINWDHEGASFVVALDKRTGKELWRKDRPKELTSWTTPLIREHEGLVHVIVAGAERTRSYDIRNGELLWSVSGLGMNVIPTPIYDAGILYLASGKRDSPRMLAVDLKGARGNLDGTKAVLWTRDRDTPYVSTPLLYRGQLYFFRHVQSFLTSVDAATGRPLFTERVGLGNVFASPAAAAGKIYLLGREGKALVLEPGPTLKVLAENQLDDGFDASPVIVGSNLYLRGRRFLYAVAHTVKR